MKKIFTLICFAFLGFSAVNAQEKLDREKIKIMADQKTEKVTQLLGLSPDQAKKVHAAYQTKEINMSSLNKGTNNEKSIAKFDAGFMAQMKSALTEEQLAKFKEIRSKAKGY